MLVCQAAHYSQAEFLAGLQQVPSMSDQIAHLQQILPMFY